MKPVGYVFIRYQYIEKFTIFLNINIICITSMRHAIYTIY